LAAAVTAGRQGPFRRMGGGMKSVYRHGRRQDDFSAHKLIKDLGPMITLHTGRKGLEINGADWRVVIVSASFPGGEAAAA